MSSSLDLLALGNAIVDVIAHTEDDFLVARNLHKGSMNLINEETALELYEAMGPATIISGGSAANTIAGAASLGLKTGFIGKVRDDGAGDHYRHDMRAMGTAFDTPAATDGPATARSFILVTPDGERTMNTYLGACQGLSTADVEAEKVRAAAITYLEGYLWDPQDAKDAFRKAVELAHGAGNRVALTLSDSFCVDRFRDEFLGLMREGHIDILFANIHELKALYQTADDDTALAALRDENLPHDHFIGAITRSEEGALVVTRQSTQSVKAHPVDRVVDTTGAGDLFAAGFLSGLTKGLDHVTCARLGGMAAAEIISHLGARPEADLADMARQNGLI
ncbi:MAG: ribokinase family sugar kinase [Saliniramus fredricksonii]|uniref:Ribokinase family sugar kinase n=1 Tax=Saliniramus fredricksonii TaxID=1653334 RepID=A0A0P8A0T7_9HYPH|nr:MAG: ribokinase family sugar kinase [Saliniramus fredricksonii]